MTATSWDLRADDQPDDGADRFRSKLLTIPDLRTLPPPRHLVRGVLDLDSLVFAYGPRGNYKSFLVDGIGACVATGTRWCGREVDQGHVIYVAAEGVGGLAPRFDAWESAHPLVRLSDRFHVLPEPVNLLSPGSVGQFVAAIEDLDVHLVVFDTLARCMVGGDENSSKDAGLAIEQLDAVRRHTGACVTAVHHAGKNLDAGARGSSAFEAAADTVLQVTADGELVTVTTTKQKNHPAGNPIRLQARAEAGSLVLVEYDGSIEAGLPAAVFDTLATLAEIEVPGGVSTTVWKVAVNASERSFYRHLKGLLKHGYVENVGSEKRPRYQVTPAGAAMLPKDCQ